MHHVLLVDSWANDLGASRRQRLYPTPSEHERVQKFLLVDELQDNLRVERELGSDSLKIKGNFCWGFEENKVEEPVPIGGRGKRGRSKTVT
jgi:hypothetical protein